MAPKTLFTAETRPLVPDLHLEQGSFRLRFAVTDEDLDRILRMRYEVFNVEMNEGLEASRLTGRDQDEFDEVCQHLMVEEISTGRVVGTYRLQATRHALAGKGLYSAGEFDLSGIPADVLDRSVELGRACIAKEFRTGRVLFFLWRGLVAYVDWHEARYLFGCSSLTSQDPRDGLWLSERLRRMGAKHEEWGVRPLAGFECETDASLEEHPGVQIPKLFGIYLRYGAKMLGEPALDRRFKTIDFLTLLDLYDLTPETLAQLS